MDAGIYDRISSEDTIAAISTAVSESGIGIIRISGPKAIAVADRVFRPASGNRKLAQACGYTMHYGYIYDNDTLVDEVLASVMRSPKSFTAEDTVEINCHGGVYAMRRVLETVLQNGARLAEPGEFTRRAFLNGRIDLSQAEAVMDVIHSTNEYALQNSLSQLKGAVLEKIRSLRAQILYETAYIESSLDDPEHYSLEGYTGRLQMKNKEWISELNRLISSSENGRILCEGIRTVILGKPNVGKSSLMNCMLGEERAIVTEIEGTTRDVLTEMMKLGDITLKIADTAGIRDTQDPVEMIGVSRAREQADEADLILFVADASAALDENDLQILRMIENKKAVILLNKSDLPPAVTAEDIQKISSHPVIWISAKLGEGMDQLERELKDMFFQGELEVHDEILITNVRQKLLLEQARDSLEKVEEGIACRMPEDFLAIDLMEGYSDLGRITGENYGDDLADEIFGKFCMGK